MLRTPLIVAWLLAALLVLASDTNAIAGHSPTHWDFEEKSDLAGWRVAHGSLGPLGSLGLAPGRGVRLTREEPAAHDAVAP